MSKSRKPYVVLVFTLAFALLLASCGQSTNHNAESSPSSSESLPSPSSGEAANGTKIYAAANGDIEVPVNPQRIVDVTAFYTGFFVALGAPLAGAMDNALANPYLKGKVDGVANLGTVPSPESILALKPDLIIAYKGTDEIDQLAKIAPVVAVEYGKLPYKEQMIEFGKLTGKEAEASAWVDQWEKKIADLKPKVQAAVGAKTVSILNPYAKGLYVFGHNFGRGGEIIYGEFGLKAPEEAQKAAIDSGTGWASITLEKLPEFAGDIIFTCPWSGDTSDPKIVYDNALWTTLPAVKAGNVFQLNPAADTYNDPVSLDAQLDFIANSLLSVKS